MHNKSFKTDAKKRRGLIQTLCLEVIMLKMFRNGARIAAPIIIIIQLLTIVKGYKNPLPEAADILSQHGNKVSILTGFSYSQFHDSETYLLIDPENFSSYSVVMYKEKGELKVFDKTDGLLNYLFGYVFLIVLFWWSWFWPAKHNNSLQKRGQIYFLSKIR